jgi:dynein heavy chain
MSKNIERIEEITMMSEKKFTLAKKLKTLKDELKVFDLSLFPYKGDKFVMRAVDEVNTRLDDQIVTTQTMLGSAFMKGKLRTDSKTWETKLNNMSELVDEMMKVQRGWMYLEPIFASDDIEKQMPTEAANFREVDTLWKTTMEGINEQPGIMDLAEKEGIKQSFDDANKKLDKI